MTVQPEQGIKHELSLGEVIQKTFELYQRDFTKYFVLFAIVGAIIGVVMTIARQIFILPSLPSNPTPQQVYTWLPGFFATLIPLISSIVIVSIVFSAIAQGSAVKMASEQIVKGQTDLGGSVRFTASKLPWIWALSIVVGIIVFLGFIALIIPGIILAIMFSLAFPVLIIENKKFGESMGRSRQLVCHRWLKTLGTFLVLAIIVGISAAVAAALSAPFGIASPVVSGLLAAFYQPLFPILLTVYYFSNRNRFSIPPAPQMPPGPGATVQSEMMFCPSCGARLESQT